MAERALRSATWLLVLALVAPLAAQGERTGELRSVLRRRSADDERTPAELVAALAKLGPASVPVLYAMTTGRGLEELVGEEWVPAEWLCDPEDVPGLCASALERAPVDAVLAELEHALERGPGFQERLVILRVLGAQASADGLALVLRDARELGDLELERPSVRLALCQALRSILRGDARAFVRVEGELDELEPWLCELLAEAVGACGRARGMAVLEGLFVRDDLARERVLEAMAELEVSVPWELTGRTLEHCRAWLDGQDPAARARVLTLAGRLHALELVPTLIEAVGGAEPLARRCALDSLRGMAALPLEPDVPALTVWLEREQRWKDARWPMLFRTLREGAPGDAHAALRELGRHPLYRHLAAREVAESLSELPRAIVPTACAELERLGSRWALPGLLDALADPLPQLRAAAWRALQGLTGESQALSVELWRELVDS